MAVYHAPDRRSSSRHPHPHVTFSVAVLSVRWYNPPAHAIQAPNGGGAVTSNIEPNAGRPHQGPATPLDQGIALARAGDHVLARAVFRRMIHSDPYDENAWLWLAWVAE